MRWVSPLYLLYLVGIWSLARVEELVVEAMASIAADGGSSVGSIGRAVVVGSIGRALG